MRNSGKRQSLNQHSHTFVNFLRARLSQLFGRYRPVCVCVCARWYDFLWIFFLEFCRIFLYPRWWVKSDKKTKKKVLTKNRAAHIKIRIVFFFNSNLRFLWLFLSEKTLSFTLSSYFSIVAAYPRRIWTEMKLSLRYFLFALKCKLGG